MKISLFELKQIIKNILAEEFEFSDQEINERRKKKWIPKNLNKGALSRYFGIPEEEENIPISMINDEIKKLHNKKEREGNLTKTELKLLRRLNFAKTMKKM